MGATDLRERTMRFALATADACRTLTARWPERRAADQLFRSATSIAANYYAAGQARSRREWVAKLGIVTEEAQETVFWLEFLIRAEVLDIATRETLLAEARELLAIFVASRKTASAALTEKQHR
jgi:four helix bundle protein